MSHSLRFIWILCEVCFCSTFLSFHLVDALFFFCCGSKPEERHCNRGNGWMRSLYKTAQQHQWHSKFCAVALGMGAHAELWQTHTEMTRTFTHTHTHTQPRTYCIAALPRFPIAPHGSCLPFRNWPSAESNICARMLQMPFRYDAMAMWNRKFVGGALFNNTFTHGDASKYSHRHRRERARAARSLPY